MTDRDDALFFAGNQIALMQSLSRLLAVTGAPRDSSGWREYLTARREAEELLRTLDSTDALERYIAEAA
jgi:hypothetical protein